MFYLYHFSTIYFENMNLKMNITMSFKFITAVFLSIEFNLIKFIVYITIITQMPIFTRIDKIIL